MTTNISPASSPDCPISPRTRSIFPRFFSITEASSACAVRHTIRKARIASIVMMFIAMSPQAAFAESNSSGSPKAFGRIVSDLKFQDGEGFADPELTSLRLGVRGDLRSDLGYKIELERKSDGALKFTDAFVEFDHSRTSKFIVGQYKPPVSLDELTSGRHTTMHARAGFTDQLDFRRRLGISYTHHAGDFQLSAGLFSKEDFGDPQLSDPAIAARTLKKFATSKNGVGHFGVSVLLPLAETDVQKDNVQNEDSVAVFEFATATSDYWLASEVSLRDEGLFSDPGLSAYFEIGGVIGGERQLRDGRWDAIQVFAPFGKGGYGATSYAVRLESFESDPNSSFQSRTQRMTMGVDWWPTKRHRLGANVQVSRQDEHIAQTSLAPGERTPDWALNLRAQLDF